MGLSLPTAERWVDRWERQQQRYAVDREERFTVVTDVVEHVTEGQTRPYVVDLGCGPGSLPARLGARLPHARIVAVDMDPLLLELARTRHPRAARYVQAVIGEEGWIGRLGLSGPVDAVVSTTALHYLPEEDLRRAYADLTRVLRPGGVLVNADHLGCGSAALAGIAEHVGARRARRAGARGQRGLGELVGGGGRRSRAGRAVRASRAEPVRRDERAEPRHARRAAARGGVRARGSRVAGGDKSCAGGGASGKPGK